jgi:hypothetical protein
MSDLALGILVGGLLATFVCTLAVWLGGKR